MHLNKKHRETNDQVYLASEAADSSKVLAAHDAVSAMHLASDVNQVMPVQETEQEVVVKTEDFGEVSLTSVLQQLPLQVMTEALQDQDAPHIMHLVLPENFEGTLQLQWHGSYAFGWGGGDYASAWSLVFAWMISAQGN